jgi:small nuclear ribonucleoprotein (snRNP)-like protein
MAEQCLLHVVVGTLMGYDPLLNLVLDNTVEYLKGKGKKVMYLIH